MGSFEDRDPNLDELITRLQDETPSAQRHAHDLRSDAMERQFTATDKRQVLTITMDGAGGVRDVRLDPNWQRILQTQALKNEVVAVYRTACDRAAASHHEGERDSGDRTADVAKILRTHSGLYLELSERLDAETVQWHAERSRVTAEFRLSGEFVALQIPAQYAAKTDAGQLAEEIRQAFVHTAELAAERRARIAAETNIEEDLHKALDRQLLETRTRFEAIGAEFDRQIRSTE